MQLRQDLGREDGWRNGFRQPRWQDSSHGRRQLVRHPGGRGAPGNEVAFLVTSGASFRGRESGAEFAGGESFAQRPESGPPQGAAASCPVSARVDTRGGPRTSPWEGMPKLVGNPRFNWTDPRIRRSGLFLGVQIAGLLAGARLTGDTCFDWTDPGIRRSGLSLGVLVVDLGDLSGGLRKVRLQVVAGDQLPFLGLPN